MTVRIGDITFHDWVSLPFQDGWTDTFIFRMPALACLPPYDYAKLIRRMAAPVRRLRRSASIWIQVEAPGKWYEAEVRRALRGSKGLQLPVAVTGDEDLDWLDFSFRPWLGHSPSQRPPVVEDKPRPVSPEALACLQALTRMDKGDEHEIAALTGLSVATVLPLLHEMEKQKLVIYKRGQRIFRKKTKPVQMDLFPLWHLSRRGISLALRSWGVPPNLSFKHRFERNRYQIGYEHRHIARIWPAWLKSAWPQAEVWTGWSEVGIPGLSVVPDALAWGRIQGCETLFWLEVGEEHKDEDKIVANVGKRLRQAIQLCERTGVSLVFALLTLPWVLEKARWACTQLPPSVAVVMGDRRRFGELPVVEWGRVMMS